MGRELHLLNQRLKEEVLAISMAVRAAKMGAGKKSELAKIQVYMNEKRGLSSWVILILFTSSVIPPCLEG